AVKESGTNITVVTVAGFTNLDTCERDVAQGKADLIGGARAWISNPNFGRLAYEGKGEDVVPCLRCNKCHVNTIHGPYLSTCSVNPEYGLEHQLRKMAPAPVVTPGNIAVIGGGPAGMEAAQVAANRGHKVTLFEKNGELGGQLIPASVPDFKWTLKLFKDYMVRKTLENPNIDVKFYSEVKPGELKGYDKVIVAIGADPIVIPIPGHDRANVITGIDAFLNPERVKGKVVVIGGGEIGVEAGMFLAKQGHPSTVLEMRDMLAADATPIHYYNMVRDAWEATEGFSSILKATVTGITDAGVSYKDEDGVEHTIEADTVVMAVGTRSKKDEAYAFYAPGTETTVIGDAEAIKTVQGAMRSGYAAGNNA
ncbi:MAG: FAD-dependent oxidoreductase, partial [Oscillospiraceae bacterium]|nr:FAD-dependent oxidoreductase [Oscillospiraceae bacterium]